jgi:hypothetical protein
MKVSEKAIQFHRVLLLGPSKRGHEIGLASNFTLQCPQRSQGTSFFYKMRTKLKTLPKFPQANFFTFGFYFNITVFVLKVNFH